MPIDSRCAGHAGLSLDVLKQVSPADDQRLEPRLERALERPVLDLDGDVAVVAGVGQRAEEGAPADVAQAGDLGRVPELGIGQDAVLIERVRDRSGRPWRGRGRSGRGTRAAGRGSPSAARSGARGRSSGRSSGWGCRRTSAARSPGEVARFLPPGHSSWVKSIGQFSMPIRTFLLSACATSGRQISRNRGQLASTDSAGSRPTNEFTWPTPSAAAASITLRRWATATSASARSADERVGVVAQARDRHLVDRQQVLDLLDRVHRQVGHVDVRDPGIPPLGLAGRPAHQLDAREPRLVGEAQDLLERVLRQDRRDESEFHGHASQEIMRTDPTELEPTERRRRSRPPGRRRGPRWRSARAARSCRAPAR